MYNFADKVWEKYYHHWNDTSCMCVHILIKMVLNNVWNLISPTFLNHLSVVE